jgi:hypothetical protein
MFNHDGWVKQITGFRFESKYGFSGTSLTPDVAEWLGINRDGEFTFVVDKLPPDDIPQPVKAFIDMGRNKYARVTCSLVKLNDGYNATFSDIADVIDWIDRSPDQKTLRWES